MFQILTIFLFVVRVVYFTTAKRIVIASERGKFDNAGTEFIFALSENYALRYNATVLIANTSPVEVHASIVFKSDRLNVLNNVTIPYGEYKTVYLPNSVVLKRHDGILIQDGIVVTASNDIVVQIYNDVHQRSMDGFLALPTRALGKEYYVMAYNPWIQSQLAVVGIEDDTEINIISSQTFQFLSNTEIYAGSRIRIDLNRLEAAQLRCPGCDFSGTHITSNKPIAVMSGNRCASVPVEVESCDHLVEQIPPVNQWGKTFVASPLMGRGHSGGNRFRVMAARYGTEIGFGANHVALKPGQYHDFELAKDETTLVVSNQPVLLVQFSSSLKADNVTGDPSMTIVPALEQRVKVATFVTYDNTKEKTSVLNYISVYAECSDFDDVELDGRTITTIPDVEFKSIDLTEFCVASVRVYGKGIHNLSGNTNNTIFSAILYGFAYYNSFAHPAVMGLRDTLCTLALPDNGTLEHNCNEQVVVVELPSQEKPLIISNTTSDYSQCVNPGVVIAIGMGCGLIAVFIETIVRVKVFKKHNYMDREFYTTKELYHRKAVVRRQHRDEQQEGTIYKH